jgi:membrane-associated protein
MEFLDQLWTLTLSFVDIFLHVDMHLNELVNQFGIWTYAILFLIIFCETGLVVMPLLPGDSLLFAIGAIAAIDGSILDVHTMAGLLIVAAIIGDAVNYSVGKYLGPRVFKKENSRFLNRNHLVHTQEFYHRHGGKTIILARFVPIIRTFAPFVAGIGHMSYSRFAAYNVVGAFAWVLIFLYAGFFMGNLPQVKTNFHYIIVAIIFISALPGVIEFFRARRRSNSAQITEPTGELP